MKFPLEQRMVEYAKSVRRFLVSGSNLRHPDTDQLLRSSGSVGANYIEANEAVSKKDLQHRLKIAKKEGRESLFWLQVIVIPTTHEIERKRLIQETQALVNILSSIIEKTR